MREPRDHGFFRLRPECFGGTKKDNPGRLLQVYFEGLPGPVETDIPSNHSNFRCRKQSVINAFFELHELKDGDGVMLEWIGEYELGVFPDRRRSRSDWRR